MIRNLTRETVVGTRIFLAQTSLARAWGLLGRTELDEGWGMLLKPFFAVHTIGMRFDIDVVGLDAEFRVVGLWPRLAPWRIRASSHAIKAVLELAAGQIEATGVCVGDSLQVEAVVDPYA